MTKRAILAVAAIFIAWSLLDFLLHGLLLQSTYAATAHLWRPMDAMNMPLMYLVTLLVAAAFVAIYLWLVEPKSLGTGIRLGLLFGLATGISMGFGSYSYMPIPVSLAWSWFLGTLVECAVAGAIAGWLIRR
ncbi:MAG: hypothetical protein A2286_00565 [Gammaproteobacteria bacterium RIFOXYA12_FULL_61_12]|nr:MAG: hypothetical protein A2514_08680 [Gammaproteobacteria bacterium RIFOXYD12_FULL_61_37]OGT94107.1 MAG: hypothetical protein A2286_00565 [Gammaproteobacteria bacterium RIFOXYA12_FULL_61_12]